MNTQLMADNCKSYVDTVQHKNKRAVLRTIQNFEGYGWHAGIFAQALSDTECNEISIQAGAVTFAGHSSDVLAAIDAVLVRYIEIYETQ